MGTCVEVVLPCLDEATALPGALAAVPPASGAIVVDNGSTDGFAQVAAADRAYLVHEPRVVRMGAAPAMSGVRASGFDPVHAVSASLAPSGPPR